MAGCFGNSPVDRWIENDLYNYLAAGDAYEILCENITKLVSDEDFNKWYDQIEKYLYYIAPKVERGIMSLEEAQRIVAKTVKNLK